MTTAEATLIKATYNSCITNKNYRVGIFYSHEIGIIYLRKKKVLAIFLNNE